MAGIRLRSTIFCILAVGIAASVLLFIVPTAVPSTEAPEANSPVEVIPEQSTNLEALTAHYSTSQEIAHSKVSDKRLTDSRRVELLADFNNISNGRAFAEKHWQNKNPGGTLYVRTLLKQCELAKDSDNILQRGDVDFTKLPQEHFVSASKALSSLQARCSQFTADDYRKYISTAEQLTSPNDPYDSLLRDFLKASDLGQHAKRSAITNILQNPDPLIFDEVGVRLSMTKNGGEAAVFFNGVSYPINGDPEIVSAYRLLPCGLGLQCNEGDFEVLLSCALGRGCFANRFEMIKQNELGGDTARYANVMSLYSSMLEAIRQRNTDAFIKGRAN